MKKRIILMASLLAMVMIFAGAIEAQATRVAVLGFEAADSSWFEDSSDEQEMLENITEEFNIKLSEIGDYTVLSHRRVQDLYEELNTRPGRRPTHSIINQLRGRTNADIFAYGSIDRVDYEEKDEFRVGPVRFSEVELTVELSIEMIDARNPRSSDTYTGTGRITHTGINIVDSRGDRIRLQAFDEDALDRTISLALDNLIANITGEDTVEEIVERTVEAEVVSIVGDRLVINKGSRDGLEVGQTGDIIRYTTTSSGSQRIQVVGTAEVTDLDRNSGFTEITSRNISPQVGDIIEFTIEEVSERDRQVDPIEVVETRDFRIEIHEAVKSNGRVTIYGEAFARRNDAELTLLLGNRDFYDHNENRRDMTGKRVSIGGWTHSSRTTATVTDTIRVNEPKTITWSFTNVPENADRISRVVLWFRTEYDGDISIDLRNIRL